MFALRLLLPTVQKIFMIKVEPAGGHGGLGHAFDINGASANSSRRLLCQNKASESLGYGIPTSPVVDYQLGLQDGLGVRLLSRTHSSSQLWPPHSMTRTTFLEMSEAIPISIENGA